MTDEAAPPRPNYEIALKEITERKKAFQQAFGSPAGKAVLDDLKPFCRARQTCVVLGDRDLAYVFEGRRQVYLRIQDYLDLTPEELVVLNTRPAQER